MHIQFLRAETAFSVKAKLVDGKLVVTEGDQEVLDLLLEASPWAEGAAAAASQTLKPFK